MVERSKIGRSIDECRAVFNLTYDEFSLGSGSDFFYSNVDEMFVSALDLSWTNTFAPLAAVHQGKPDKIENSILKQLIEQEKEPKKKSSNKLILKVVSSLQSLFSLILILLAGLAIRRRFQIG